MLEWLSDGRRLIAVAIIFATLVAACFFRFETVGSGYHRNRLTGAVCNITVECWFSGYGR